MLLKLLVEILILGKSVNIWLLRDVILISLGTLGFGVEHVNVEYGAVSFISVHLESSVVK